MATAAPTRRTSRTASWSSVLAASRRAPGDRVSLGDWNCDGEVTPAVLRPTTGAVFVFDKWATGTSDVSVSPTATIAGAVDVQARDDLQGCSTLVIIRNDGTEQEIN
jgi:hypothetical protein